MDIYELFSTPGKMLFFGGIAGMVLSVLSMIILVPVFTAERKRTLEKNGKELGKH